MEGVCGFKGTTLGALGTLNSISCIRMKQGYLYFDADYSSHKIVNVRVRFPISLDMRVEILEMMMGNYQMPSGCFAFFRNRWCEIRARAIWSMSQDPEHGMPKSTVITNLFNHEAALTAERARIWARSEMMARDVELTGFSPELIKVFEEERDTRAPIN
jgi:hypothetical protein